MLDEIDMKILSSLIEADEPITSYKIFQLIGTTRSTITYKLKNFVMAGIVDEHKNQKSNGKNTYGTTYSPHPILLCDDCMIEMGELITLQARIIDKHQHTSIDGFKMLLDFIIQRVPIVEK